MMQRSNSQLDEGFSETRSSSDSEMLIAEPSSDHKDHDTLLSAILALPHEARKRFADELVRSLTNADKESIKELVENLTHFDPAFYLPNEIFLHIFGYLAPHDLIRSSTVSRSWRARALDEKLWRLCFAREGWVMDKPSIEVFEKLAEKKGVRIAEGILKENTASPLRRRESRKRPREEAFSEGEAAGSSRAAAHEAREDNNRSREDSESDENMDRWETAVGEQEMHLSRTPSASSNFDSGMPGSPSDLKMRPTLFQNSRPQPKLSWAYLYKQRRRIERNWEQGHYKTFQLPQDEFANEEGHKECVYTIQHTHRHLVSGSRDKTIRIWDLNTYRLKGKPLRGHDASVLCLQFDERPEHDIIVSGGSDSYVIIWRFSTGEILKKMTSAHSESVLNLRFDDRYIVTCSKDKTIKIWNRHALARESPLIPTLSVNTFNLPNATNMIEEFSLLTTIAGHNAAVNAVMIHGDTIVSASGDRTVKAWDLHTGKTIRSYTGHTKGIACVQADGRRIVSGSSDNTVRIFDADKQAEVACLSGHTNLVRTVQARFGDLDITTDAELEAEADEATRGFHRAYGQGMRPASVSRRSGITRNAGSSRPEDMLSYGTKVPPGGGGSRWAKIVSGSYDESVIVWKRDREGKWHPGLTLQQDHLVSRRRRHHVPAHPPPLVANANAQPPPNATAAAAPAHPPVPLTTTTAAQHIAHAAQHHAANLQTSGHNQLAQAAHTHTAISHQLSALHAPTPAPAAQTSQAQTSQAQTSQAPAVQHPQPANGAPAHAPAPVHPPAHAAPPPQPPQQQAQQPATPPAAQAAQAAAAGANPAAGAGAGAGGAQTRDSNRVFKLQFDARRIVCCSQNRTIVGWDFAAGDPELERVGGWCVETG